MNKENSSMVASRSSHILGKHSTTEAFISQKSELLPHSFFFDGARSKVIFRVTQNPTTVSFALPRNYLALRGCRSSHPRPMVAGGEVGYKPVRNRGVRRHSPDGRFRFGLCECVQLSHSEFHNAKK